MTNYQNDIMELLQGDTPKQKYEYLKELLQSITGQKFLFTIKYHYLHGVPAEQIQAIQAHNKDEALEIFWKGKNKEDWEVTNIKMIDTMITGG